MAAHGADGGIRRIKVAIVGGGCAGLAAAWELSRPRPQRADRDATEDQPCAYDITIFEQSWRLGGKGASGRDEYGRIREHGIHIWLGFYENAFRMMRECYEAVSSAKWGPANDDRDTVLPYASFDEAFFPEPHLGVATRYNSDIWKVWSGFLPPMKGLPGTPLDEDTNPFTLQAYMVRCLELSKALIHSMLAPASPAKPGDPRPNNRSTLDEALDLNFSSYDPLEAPSVLVERMTTLMRTGVLATAAGILQGVTIVETMLRQRDPAPQFSEGLLKFVEALATNARRQLRDFVAIDPETRMKTQVIDLIITIMVGLFRDRVLTAPEGLDAINHIDCKEWLLKHGAVAESVDSAFVTGLYDLAFCYADGDRAKPQLAAGQALRGALRMFFSYRGAIFWRMRGGMGETVFSPLFRVLRRRDVKFRFLHSLTDVQFKADPAGGMRVAELTFDVATGGEGFTDDRPLDHFGCWRHDRPPTTRDGRPRRLVDGRDFDAVIFAMGFDDFNAICGPRLRNQTDAKVRRLWENMLSTTKTVATQAAQVWMTKDLAGLGWQRGPILVSALEEPFETWADMTHTLAAERAWRAHRNAPAHATDYGTDVKSIAYFCGVLPDSVVQKLSPPDASFAQTRRALNEKIVADLDDLLANRMDFLWPAAYPQDPRRRAHARRSTSPLRFLATAHGTAGGKLWDQHLQASFHRSDRYTLAVPGSLEYRISPLRRLVDNMTIAGDWTECGFNEGCIEAAVMSGMLAAHAISGQPDLNDIVGYNHP